MYLRAFFEGVNIEIEQEKSLRRDRGATAPLTLRRHKGGTALLGCARAPQLRVEDARTSQGLDVTRALCRSHLYSSSFTYSYAES
jgi:hypothetical protein